MKILWRWKRKRRGNSKEEEEKCRGVRKLEERRREKRSVEML